MSSFNPQSHELTPDQREGLKLRFEFYKHITTVNTASILIILTLLEKLKFKQVHIAFLLVMFGAFVISIIASLMGMNEVYLQMKNSNMGHSTDHRRAFQVATLGFVMGLGFVLLNFYLAMR